MKILIDNGGYNFKNNGDSAMLYVTASRLHKKYPQAEINVFTCAPNSLKEIIPFAVPVLVNGRRQWSNEWNILGGFHKLLPACTYSWLQDKENIFKVKYPNVARRWIERRLSKRGYDTLAMRVITNLSLGSGLRQANSNVWARSWACEIAKYIGLGKEGFAKIKCFIPKRKFAFKVFFISCGRSVK